MAAHPRASALTGGLGANGRFAMVSLVAAPLASTVLVRD
jgi:hypothetical protein